MDLVQIICYRLVHIFFIVLDWLNLILLPLYSADTHEYVKESEELPVFRGTYRQVVDEVRKAKTKILLLFFYSSQQPESRELRRQTLGDPALQGFLKDSPDILFFPVSIESFSGWQLAYSFYCPRVPSFVIVRASESGNDAGVVERIDGVVDAQKLVQALRSHSAPRQQLFMEHLSDEADDELGGQSSAQESFEASTSNLNYASAHGGGGGTATAVTTTAAAGDGSLASIIAQQRADYERSLAIDRGKELDRAEREADQKRQREAEKEKQAERDRLVELAKDVLESEPEAGGIRLAIQLPDGTKIQRKFSETASARQVYAFTDINYLENCKDAMADYRLQSLHPPFHISRNAPLSEYGIEGHHKLYVDLTPVALLSSSPSSSSEGDVEDMGQESDVDD